MFNFKKEEPKIQIEPPKDETLKIKTEVLEHRIEKLAKQVIEQEIVIRRLLDLVIMNIEHKEYSKFLLPQITKVKILLDKIK